VRVPVSFLSLTVNTENERINTFIYDDVVGGKMGGAYFYLLLKTVLS
jgi:hypothetical protein